MKAEARKEDRRVRKTRQQIEQTLADLMLEKPVQEITVMELTERADINRGTFYLHYRDIYDLLSEMETSLLDKLKETLNRQSIEDLKKDPSLKFVDMFRFLAEHRQLSYIVLNSYSEQSFLEAAKEALQESAFVTLTALYGPGRQDLYDQFFTFGISGSIGLAQKWLQSGCQESPEEMGRMCNDFLELGRSVLRKDRIAETI